VLSAVSMQASHICEVREHTLSCIEVQTDHHIPINRPIFLALHISFHLSSHAEIGSEVISRFASEI
jgi:hypothetical protein